jgi:trans-2,3-dihydro-3-hydroxyanthranilate isomerase
LNFGNWEKSFPLGNHSVYCFAPTVDEEGVDFGARMFSPGIGTGEDAGTGAAAAALIGLLAKQADFDDGHAEYHIRQGYEMGRPCRISVQLKKESGKLTHGGIGGSAIIVGEGVLDLPDNF